MDVKSENNKIRHVEKIPIKILFPVLNLHVIIHILYHMHNGMGPMAATGAKSGLFNTL